MDVVGNALFDGQLLDVHFTRSFYKHIVCALTYHDIKAIDTDHFKNLKWLFENDISDILDLTCNIDADGEKLILYERNEVTDYRLIPGGQNIRFTEENKQKYVNLVVENLDDLRRQIQDILDTVQHHRLFSGSEKSFKVLARKTKLAFFNFITGTSKVPLEGRPLQGICGSQNFPSAHTFAMLLDSGNLVVKDANDDNPENFLWQSFSFPTDTFLPNMKLGKNFKTGHDDLEKIFYCNIVAYDAAMLPEAKQDELQNVIWRSVSRLVLTNNGYIQLLTWVNRTKSWHLHINIALDTCDTYSFCGAYGSCVIDSSPVCGCLDKFVAKHPKHWERGDWSEGCVRKTPLNCSKEYVFLRYCGIKLPDTKYSQYDKTRTLEGCRKLSGRGQDIYIRMDSSELGSNKKKAEILAVSFSLLVAMILLGLILLLYIRKKKKLKLQEDFELPQFQLSTITRATNNFSVNKKIVDGGFGPVYKGMLEEGQEIAVKRLSRTSTQGLDEFKNDAIYIAKLQHRNLVRLLDQTMKKLLDWPKRFHIINGIACALLYLHQDSRLWIIHRDLKASNVLLDIEMNPKISDFGLARCVAGNEMGAKTHHVVGTHGYMSPEYAVDGIFSVKSDVFSFGVLVLEIVSGKRNRGFVHQDHNLNLLGHVNSSGLLCLQQCPQDRPNMSFVVQMLTNESTAKAKEPGFFTERMVVDAENSGFQTGSSNNEVTITSLDPR
ncbi:hypothetical protein K7X08_014379 [Anisodus acutangulus]|uniref:HECT-type E3 ubiquitin transferase n=1 Tax=Anisodus acutangulus TaxID=402998 RepID=A0A9Q1LLH8_9SOLA|nr:hypothetical protein K7X08_014379 [Anisodus acutangulus]